MFNIFILTLVCSLWYVDLGWCYHDCLPGVPLEKLSRGGVVQYIHFNPSLVDFAVFFVYVGTHQCWGVGSTVLRQGFLVAQAKFTSLPGNQ